ncbi:putative baseplate assembly protein [Amycolatopsis anabasis]|uniref:putative baseplate assembly protein n=1 Tax=Amycolatopsis anabasis TaxID=1840409 RepID=UPI00131DEF54|nr:putative baseplate assembly protein [Amycolatopsis anabasis]
MSCVDERRRVKVRECRRNGIDAISVSDDRTELAVTFFGDAPEDLEPANFRIDGGRRITGIEVVAVERCADEDPELEDRICLTVDRPGDLSVYRLCVVEADPCGRPGTEPHPGFDPRYACLEFTFATCEDVDCAPDDDRPQRTYPEPEIDYLSKDYASFRQLLLDRLSLTMPGWTERHVPDIGIALVELLAYEGDRLSYRQDAVATEAYLATARRRVSVRRHARLVDYAMHDGCAARSWVCLEAEEQAELDGADFRFVTLPDGVLPRPDKALLHADLDRRDLPPYQVFEPVRKEKLVLRPAHNKIPLWTWGDFECCLPKGATAATLADGKPGEDRVLHLAPGDVLLFEEVLGPKTGVAADADHTHRQAVRLTSVTPAVDELYRQPLLEVTWAREDALTFPLCVNARGGPDCADLEVGVARGNVVLVEHGSTLGWCDPSAGEGHDVPAPAVDEPGCPDPVGFGCPDETRPARRPAYPPLPIRFRPELKHQPVTQSVPFPAPADIAEAQARWLLGLADRARDRLRELWRKAGHQKLSEADIKYLKVAFGAKVLAKLDLDHHPRRALRHLLARFDELLETKLDRLAELIRRARAGYVLTARDEGWEIGQSWGAEEGALIDPDRAAFRGPAALALRPDPRAALPAIGVTDQYGKPWEPRRDLLESGPADRHFVGELTDTGRIALRFGDGRNGARYPLGDPRDPLKAKLRARYRVGNGAVGNVGREAINRIVFCSTRVGGITVVRNPLPATGGVDPEPVSEVRRRAPREPRHRLLRAITAADYAALAGRVPGVQRAAGDLRWTGSWYEAQVAVDPVGATGAPDWLLDEVREALHRYRRIGHDLAVSSAALVPLELALRVEVRPDHVTGHVRTALRRVLGSGRGGFFHPDNLTFGTPVRISQVIAVAAAVPGVLHVEVTELERLFGPLGTALDTGVLPIRPLEVAQLDDDPTRPENGRLRLDMRGGR